MSFGKIMTGIAVCAGGFNGGLVLYNLSTNNTQAGGREALKKELLENSKPITEKSLVTTIEPDGDTAQFERIDTVGYFVPVSQLKP